MTTELRGLHSMIHEEGEVIGCHNGQARIRVRHRGACGQCQLRKGCGAGVLARAMPGSVAELTLPTASPLEPGQRVRLGVPERGLVAAAAVVYLLPLLMLLTGAALASPWGDAATIPAAVSGLLAGLAAGRRLAARLAVQGSDQPVLLGPAAQEREPVTEFDSGKH